MGRRFAPVPIETTFKSSQKNDGPASQRQPQLRHGPNPELTPEQSPRSPSPVPSELRPKRRFAPQLVETSRRARRAGDAGPATRPTDKTDITPYTNHIYSSKPRASRKRGDTVSDDSHGAFPPSRRETEDEGVLGYLLELAAKEADRQMQEAALAAFPNSRAREGGVAHFYYHEGSESDHEPEGTPATQHHGPQHHGPGRPRRKSSDLDQGWWQKHMQEHAEQVAAQHRDEDMMSLDADLVKETDAELDDMDLSAPPDPMWTTNKRTPTDDRRESMAELPAAIRASLMPDSAAHLPGAAHAGPRTGSRGPGGPFGRPFGGLGHKHEDPKVQRMRQLASPPMLGKDLAFRTCPSPKHTKLETDHPFAKHGRQDDFRDTSGKGGGLWRGFCFRSESDEGFLVPAPRNVVPMISTPFPPATPGGARTSYFDMPGQDPRSAQSSPESSDGELASDRGGGGGGGLKVKGLHTLQGLDERLRREKAAADKEEKIAQEFGDDFVTQVYNYLSLGYPATARAYDDELSKITRLSVSELCRDDERQMAKGHMLGMRLGDASASPAAEDDAMCPRWRALRTYIREWARQHPDLDNLDPMAWGVRERRGSWAV